MKKHHLKKFVRPTYYLGLDERVPKEEGTRSYSNLLGGEGATQPALRKSLDFTFYRPLNHDITVDKTQATTRQGVCAFDTSF